MAEAEILLEEVVPGGAVYAAVEQTARSCYFYLYGESSSGFGVKSCWVRNLLPAPEELEVSSMREGEAPMLTKAHCRHPEGFSKLRTEDLAIIWAEEGDAAALTEKGEIIAIIPSWSGLKGFNGYARDCIGESPLCWELGTPSTNAQFERYAKAADFWRTWSPASVTWENLRKPLMNAIERDCGSHSKYYAIDGGAWPPKALLRIEANDSIRLATIGVCIRAQPKVELQFEDPSQHRRIELAIGLHPSWNENSVNDIARYISGQSNLPWRRFTFLGEGHTIPSEELSRTSRGTLTHFLLTHAAFGCPRVELPRYRDDPINLYWLIPISEREQRFAMSAGSTNLVLKLEAAGVTWISPPERKSVV